MSGWLDTQDLAREADDLRGLVDDSTPIMPDEVRFVEEVERLEREIGEEFAVGALMIPEVEFEEYAREFAEDIGAIKGSGWPLTWIDWKRAAQELRMDYTEVEFEGTTYLVRT